MVNDFSLSFPMKNHIQEIFFFHRDMLRGEISKTVKLHNIQCAALCTMYFYTWRCKIMLSYENSSTLIHPNFDIKSCYLFNYKVVIDD